MTLIFFIQAKIEKEKQERRRTEMIISNPILILNKQNVLEISVDKLIINM